MSLSWTTRHCWTLEIGEWRCRSQDQGYHPEKEEHVASSGYIQFHCACPQALHPITLSLVIILQDRHHRHFMDDNLAPPSPNLPSHCLGFQGLGLGFQPRSGTPQHPCSFHCAVLHSRRMLLSFACHYRKEHKMGYWAWLMCKSVYTDWVCRAHGEGSVTDFTLAAPHLTQLPPQPFRREIRECFCL